MLHSANYMSAKQFPHTCWNYILSVAQQRDDSRFYRNLAAAVSSTDYYNRQYVAKSVFFRENRSYSKRKIITSTSDIQGAQNTRKHDNAAYFTYSALTLVPSARSSQSVPEVVRAKLRYFINIYMHVYIGKR
jgi:hypothetical protein